MNITTAITEIAMQCIPNKKVCIRTSDPPWITSHIKKSIRKRKRLYRKAKQTNDPVLWNKLRDHRNKTVSLIRKSKQAHVGKVEVNIKCVIQCQEQICTKLDKIDDKFKMASAFLREKIMPNLCPVKPREICEGASSTPVFMEERPSVYVSGQAGSVSRAMRQSGEASKLSMASRKETDALIGDVIKQFISLQTETEEVDNLLKSNTESLKSLTRILQDASSLNPSSFDVS